MKRSFLVFISIVSLLLIFGCKNSKTADNNSGNNDSMNNDIESADSEINGSTNSGNNNSADSKEYYVEGKYQGRFFNFETIDGRQYSYEYWITEGNITFSSRDDNGDLIEEQSRYYAWTIENELRGFGQGGGMLFDRSMRYDPYGGSLLGKFRDENTLVIEDDYWGDIVYNRK